MEDFLGRGLAHPLRLDPEDERLQLVSGEESIAQSIRLILKTRPGERITRPDFGCAVEDLLFGPLNTVTLSRMENRVKEALRRFEPRILVEEVTARVRGAGGCVLVEVVYRIRRTNSRHNLVYPFYLEER
ncbi:MAG TPA: baseplate protein [Thermosulfurimonas dismutans]|uniref:Baseplate protein n=1 Tax=Thermosulfurimonas dismutans TaxID=999894 RepID=A0A7C3CS05_9BACT|nr:baseplate protein [Thermosulfurimonas dismutans]